VTSDIRKLAAEDFPPLLREIPDPPKQLCLRGELPAPDTKLLCVVGSRRYTGYGRDAAEALIAGLAGYPVAIVSGLALGIDSIAHRAALATGLVTVAVPGSGIDDRAIYPRSHVGLSRDILLHGGALMSEFEPDFRARPESFPQRNRIMAGMSHATLIIEASLKSGTMITARLAADYNRDVLAVPGSIFSEQSEGTHLLLSLGAAPIRTSADILEALHIDSEAPKAAPKNLSVQEQRVYDLLTEPMARDELIRNLDMPTSEATVLIMKMELNGLIIQHAGLIRRMY
jgi:DNA processing protein